MASYILVRRKHRRTSRSAGSCRDVGRAAMLPRPHRHLSETLSARTAPCAQRLIAYQAVRPMERAWILSSTRCRELQHIDVADRRRLLDTARRSCHRRAASARAGSPAAFMQRLDLRLSPPRRPVANRCHAPGAAPGVVCRRSPGQKLGEWLSKARLERFATSLSDCIYAARLGNLLAQFCARPPRG